MFKWLVNNNNVITPYNLMLFCDSYSITLFKCKNSWKRHLYSADHSANILDGLRAESQVIPSPALAAGLRPTWQRFKLTGNLESPHDITFPLRGPGTSRENFSRFHRGCPELNRAGLKQSSELSWTLRSKYSSIHSILYRKVILWTVHYSIKGQSNHCSIN